MQPSKFSDSLGASLTKDSLTELASRLGTGASMSRKQLKIVRLLEPELCLECRFAQTADVEAESGTHQRMIYCRRLDCDNWDIVNAEPAKSMEIDDYGLDNAA